MVDITPKMMDKSIISWYSLDKGRSDYILGKFEIIIWVPKYPEFLYYHLVEVCALRVLPSIILFHPHVLAYTGMPKILTQMTSSRLSLKWPEFVQLSHSLTRIYYF